MMCKRCNRRTRKHISEYCLGCRWATGYALRGKK